MPRKIWTTEEKKYLRKHFPNKHTAEIAEYLGRSYSSVAGQAHNMRLSKSEVFKCSPEMNGHLNLIIHGAKTRFQKGHVPQNKGRRQEEYMSADAIDRTKATQFTKGHLPHNTKDDGTISIRVCKGKWPYKWIRISVGNWKLLHRVRWEQANGAIPKGFNVQFKDSNTLNCELDNLELVKRGENMRRNTIHRYPPEVKGAIRQLSKVRKAIRNATEQTQ